MSGSDALRPTIAKGCPLTGALKSTRGRPREVALEPHREATRL